MLLAGRTIAFFTFFAFLVITSLYFTWSGESLAEALSMESSPCSGGALIVVLPVWVVNMETTDFAPMLVNSEGDLRGPFLPPRFELEFELLLIWNSLRLFSCLVSAGGVVSAGI